MSKLNEHLPVVKEQLEFHRQMAEKYSKNTHRTNLHKATAERLSGLLAQMVAADMALDEYEAQPRRPPKQPQPMQLSLSFEELSGLPQELIDELTGADKTEFAIVNAIDEAGGVISLDRLLVALYKKTGEILKREFLTSRLYRMAQKNLIFNVPGKKGVYSTEQLSAEEFANLFGTLKQKT